MSKNLMVGLALIVMLALAGCASSEASAQDSPTSPTATSMPLQPASATASSAGTTASSAGTTASSASAPTAACVKLNLNSLTEDQLMSTIPNFSARMVREFFEYRPYVSIQQFRREIGKYVEANQVAEYENYVYVPIDPNQADAATLMQIPGVDSALAESLVGGRPYSSTQDFIDTLTSSLSAEQAAEAACYLAS